MYFCLHQASPCSSALGRCPSAQTGTPWVDAQPSQDWLQTDVNIHHLRQALQEQSVLLLWYHQAVAKSPGGFVSGLQSVCNPSHHFIRTLYTDRTTCTCCWLSDSQHTVSLNTSNLNSS